MLLHGTCPTVPEADVHGVVHVRHGAAPPCKRSSTAVLPPAHSSESALLKMHCCPRICRGVRAHARPSTRGLHLNVALVIVLQKPLVACWTGQRQCTLQSPSFATLVAWQHVSRVQCPLSPLLSTSQACSAGWSSLSFSLRCRLLSDRFSLLRSLLLSDLSPPSACSPYTRSWRSFISGSACETLAALTQQCYLCCCCCQHSCHRIDESVRHRQPPSRDRRIHQLCCCCRVGCRGRPSPADSCAGARRSPACGFPGSAAPAASTARPACATSPAPEQEENQIVQIEVVAKATSVCGTQWQWAVNTGYRTKSLCSMTWAVTRHACSTKLGRSCKPQRRQRRSRHCD